MPVSVVLDSDENSGHVETSLFPAEDQLTFTSHISSLCAGWQPEPKPEKAFTLQRSEPVVQFGPITELSHRQICLDKMEKSESPDKTWYVWESPKAFKDKL